jgi:predicted RND superfamily exporter protein
MITFELMQLFYRRKWRWLVVFVIIFLLSFFSLAEMEFNH